MTALDILGIIYIWLLVGDLLLAIRPWEPEWDTKWQRITGLVLWPTSAWWVLRRLIRDWRDDLYYRTKHY